MFFNPAEEEEWEFEAGRFDNMGQMCEAALKMEMAGGDGDPKTCACHGRGWALSDYDSWLQCPIHYNGQRHPEDYDEDEVG